MSGIKKARPFPFIMTKSKYSQRGGLSSPPMCGFHESYLINNITMAEYVYIQYLTTSHSPKGKLNGCIETAEIFRVQYFIYTLLTSASSLTIQRGSSVTCISLGRRRSDPASCESRKLNRCD